MKRKPKPLLKLKPTAAPAPAGRVVLRALNPTTAERRSLSSIRKAIQELQGEERQILHEAMPRAEIAGEELLHWDAERGVFLVTTPAAPKGPSSEAAPSSPEGATS